MHTHHDVDIHETGLQDDCPRCAEHAENPIRDLDERMLRDLIAGTVIRAGGEHTARSHTEAVAQTVVLNVLERVGRLAECGGDLIAGYLRDRWRLEAEIKPRDYAAIRDRLET